MKHYFLYLFILFGNLAISQTTTEKHRVLFVLDASGSMEVLWGNASKMDVAKNTLYALVDSMERANPNIEIGLRVFGHQFHKSLNNCTDSKLEIPFGNNNLDLFASKLKTIKPNGHTPIAYSLMEAAKDFKVDKEVINSIILITDGLENCDGNPCEAAKLLNEKRITINPFIIGLDIADSLVNSFDCIGTFINAKDETSLKLILNNTVKQASGKTSFSIFLNSKGKQTITNTPISIIDPITKDILYTYIHSLTKKGKPDTLYLDPRGYYQVKVHSYPPVQSAHFQLQAGQHNNLEIILPKSFLDIEHEKQYDEDNAKFILRFNNNWVYNHHLEDIPVLEGNYQISTSLIPLENTVLPIEADKVYRAVYLQNGKLSIELKEAIRASIYKHAEKNWYLAYDLGLLSDAYQMKLQPGKYSLIYIDEKETNSDNTHRYDFEINAERTSVIKLR